MVSVWCRPDGRRVTWPPAAAAGQKTRAPSGGRTMKRKTATRMTRIAVFFLAAAIAGQAVAQTGYGGGRSGLPRVALPDEPWIMNTHLIPEVKVSVVARGINRPWSLAFLPKGDMLVTERGGDLRLIRDGVLVDEPVAGVPDDVLARSLAGMMEVATPPALRRQRLRLSHLHAGRSPAARAPSPWSAAGSTAPRSSTSRTCSSPSPGAARSPRPGSPSCQARTSCT